MENGIKGIRERDLAWEKSFSFPIRYCIYIIRENLFPSAKYLHLAKEKYT